MKPIILVLFCLFAMSQAAPRPGGYIAKGGVVDFKRPLDYMSDAVQAGKMAWNHKFNTELDASAQETRNERNAAAYIPTFFTTQQNHQALTSSFQRPQRQIEQVKPLYYTNY